MPENRLPRLRNIVRTPPPYPLNQFPEGFGTRFGREIVYILATEDSPDVYGKDWERIFAYCISADWAPSNVGIDDVQLGNCAWSAKSIKKSNPQNCPSVRLISGRNSPAYSYDRTNFDVDPQIIGNQVLGIWNQRVASVRERFPNMRTVVLIRSTDLTNFVVFEFETIMYPEDRYEWRVNSRGNLEGFHKVTQSHIFTWQPHGSQFTIIEDVPVEALLINVQTPKHLDKDTTLELLEYDESWITVTRRMEQNEENHADEVNNEDEENEE